MIFNTAIFFIFLSYVPLCSQPSPKEIEPEFIGGKAKLGTFLMKNFRYTSQEAKANVTGKIVVKFRVTDNGSVDSVQTIKHYGFGTGEEIVRVIQLTTKKWVPGKRSGKRVAMFVTLPIYIEPE